MALLEKDNQYRALYLPETLPAATQKSGLLPPRHYPAVHQTTPTSLLEGRRSEPVAVGAFVKGGG